MKKIKSTLILLSFAATAICGLGIAAKTAPNEAVPTFATYTNHDADTYYSGISDSLTGDSLLSALRSLNSSKRKSTVGYSGMGTSPSGQFKYTDYDPDSVQYDSNGQPYGTKLITFYSGNSATSGMNREHVWPNSHGGNTVENDIHMPRPTLNAENGSRGNSFYVEGKCHSSNGWDPAMESFGLESYRGDSARIIFYCCVAESRLSLLEADSHSTSNSNKDYLMGRLSHLIKWHLENPVLEREQNRNEGAEYLQGNRNPFIDHRSYACKIWGNANADAKKYCDQYNGWTDGDEPAKTLSTLTYSGTPTKKDYKAGESFDSSGLTVTATYSDGSTANVTSQVQWSALAKGQKSVTGSYTYNGKTLTISVGGITVTEAVVEKTLNSLDYTGTPNKKNYITGESFNPNGLTVTARFSDGTSQVVTSSVTWSSLKAGQTSVIGTYTYNGVSKTINVTGISVTDPVVDKNLVSLSYTGDLEKTKYSVGEEFDPTGLEIKARFDDGSENDVTNSVIWNELKDGDITATGSYTYKSVTKTVTIPGIIVSKDDPVPPQPTGKQVGIEIIKTPNKIVYNANDIFTKEGLKVISLYDNGSYLDITNDATVSTPDLSTSGTKIVEVRYNSFKATFSVVVLNSTVTSLQFVRTPAKTEYFVNEPFNPYGGQIKARMSDGSTLENVINECTFEYDFSKNGIVKAHFGGLSTEFAVLIIQGTPTVVHKAADFAYSFNQKLNEIEPENVSSQQWSSMKYYYNQLDDEAKVYIKDMKVASGDGEVDADVPNAEALRECVVKYDATLLAHENEGFEDFIGRNPIAPKTPDKKAKDLTPLYILLGVIGGIAVVTIIIVSIAVSVHKKSKRKIA